MIIYCLEKDRIYTFRLPSEVSGSYILSDFDNAGNKRSLISIEAKDNKWIMHDNTETKIIYNNQQVNNISVEIYTFYNLVVYGTENILLYIGPAYDENFTCYALKEDGEITCGGNNCDIYYPLLQGKQFEIIYKNNTYFFKNLNPKIPVYINNRRREKADLHNFDVLFVMGLKIFIFSNRLYINNPKDMLPLTSSKFTASIDVLGVQNYQASAEFYRDFYDEKDYFFKTPIFINALETLKITIASPPASMKSKRDPLLLTIIPSAIMGFSSILMGYYAFLNISKKGESLENNIMTIVMSVGMLVSCLVWPFVERLYEKFTDRMQEIHRSQRYRRYLKEKEQVLKDASMNQKAILKSKYLSPIECYDTILNKTPNLFSREIENDNFLTIRLGIGKVLLQAKIDYSKAEYLEFDDKLVDKADALIEKYKYMDDCPYYVSIYEQRNLSFIGPDQIKERYLNAILLQLLAYHSYEDLKIVVLTDNSCPSSLKFLKNSSYCFNEDESFRFFSTSFEEGQILSEYLEKIFTTRRKEKEQKEDISPYYLLLSDNIIMYKNLKIIHDILEEKENVNFGLLLFDSKVSNIPEGCKNFVSFTEKEASYFTAEMHANNIQKFAPEFLPVEVSIENAIARISNIPLKVEGNDSANLPDSLGFLEMYNVGRLEQLNLLQRWTSSNVVNSLATPIGIDGNGNTISLDLHEKKHGPHGLIAGMTGSGKSEFIVTYILSLAVNYNPFEVQFILIDYKGGGLAGAFENRKTGMKLPHLVGTITNLDKAEMKRTLVSINSELQRRQRVFNEAKETLNIGTIDIYKYQQLVRDHKLKEPLSHLFIICDEFAELKAQQPDFMDELVSAARIGRSLGVHLILATQKPSGVVDEQIWSNSKFKVCCKVQTTEDSNEMIRRPDAAYLKEAGRFYLQVGYDEYFVEGQSAYTGISYTPSSKVRSKVSTGVKFINHMGEIIKSVDDVETERQEKVNLGEELTNVLNYIIQVAKSINFKNQQLWLDNIPKEIYIDNVRKKYPITYEPFHISALIGEYDDPKNQAQGPVLLDLTEEGNTYIIGVTGCGKTTLLSTFIYSIITTHRVEEVNFYIIDLNTESLNKFSIAPHVSEFLTLGDTTKIEKLFYYLQNILEKRKKHYASQGGSFEQDVKNKYSIFPNIIVVINGYDVFKEQFEKIMEDVFISFTRDCTKFGIYFIITGTSTSTLSYLVENNFPKKIAMNLSDKTDYPMIFSHPSDITVIPNDNPGRGLIEQKGVYEFQVALLFDYEHFDHNFNYIMTELNKMMPKKAPALPVLPPVVTISSFKNERISLSSLSIGMEIKSACPCFYNFDNLINLITFQKEASIKSFVPALVDLFTYLNDCKVIVLSAYDYITINNEKVMFYNENFKGVLKSLDKNIRKVISENRNTHYMFVVFGYTKLREHFKKMMEEEENKDLITIDNLILLAKESKTIHFTIIDSMNQLRSVDDYPWYNLVTLNNGIIISGEVDNQELFMIRDPYNNPNIGRDDAVVIENGDKKFIKFVNKKGDENG